MRKTIKLIILIHETKIWIIQKFNTLFLLILKKRFPAMNLEMFQLEKIQSKIQYPIRDSASWACSFENQKFQTRVTLSIHQMHPLLNN